MTLGKLAKKDVSSAVKTGLVYLSAVHLATTEFLRNAVPSPHILVLQQQVLAATIIIVQVIPFLLILAADWSVRRWFSAKVASRFRVAVIAGAMVLVLRQAQLFLGPTHGLAADVDDASPILLALAMLALSGVVVFLTFRFVGPIRTFLYYFSPLAIGLSGIFVFFLQTQNVRYENYSAAEVHVGSPSLDPVYIVVFDELSYSALLGDDGEIDAQRYPNFARLGSESLHLTNATTNYFHTWVAVPELIDSTLALSSEYEVRLYEQTHRIAAFYADGCGHTYTCRDVNYLRERHQTELALGLTARAFYKALPQPLLTASRSLLHPVLDSMGTVSPLADPQGIHVISNELLSMYLADIKAESANGRVFFLHTLLPHFPYLFDEDGAISSDESYFFDYTTSRSPSQSKFEEIWPHYRDQIEYADRFLGDFLDKLESEGLYDRSTVIVTSDHGLRLSYPVPDGPIEVPDLTPQVVLMIHSPRIEPAKSDIDYQHADFGLTLRDVLGVNSPGLLGPRDDAIPGLPVPVSALSSIRPQRDKVFYADSSNQMYWRYVYNPELDEWQEVEKVEGSVGDRTELESGE